MVDRYQYASERMRVQIALVQLVAACTATRPGALVQRYINQEEREERVRQRFTGHKVLCYKDVSLSVMPDPGNPDRTRLVLEITLLHTKKRLGFQKP